MNADDANNLEDSAGPNSQPPTAAPSGDIVRVRLATRILAPLLILAILVDGAPRIGGIHRWAAKKIHIPLAFIGVYQPTWRLFAPKPSDARIHITAEVLFDDGSVVLNESPDWNELSPWESFFLCRHIKYLYRLQKHVGSDDTVNSLWEPYADYVASLYSRPDGPAVSKVSLTLYTRMIPPPNEDWISFGEEPPNVESEQFYTKEFP